MTNDIHPVLRETVVDRAQTTLRSVTSLVDIGQPGLGSIFGELIQVILPANREERMAKFVTKLDLRLKDASLLLANVFRDLNVEQIALLEDGLRASARATQERRIEQIADLVSRGIVVSDEAARQRGVLDLLDSLSDYDVAYLSRFANWKGLDDDQSGATVGEFKSMSEADQKEFKLCRQQDELSKHRLIASGLLRALMSVDADRNGETSVILGRPRLTQLGEHFCLQLKIWKSGERRLFPRN